MTNANTMIAKIAAVLAVAGLVASSVVAFTPVAGAQTATASATFTRDLTIGSTGADVTALQNWLINKGYAIAAGATGYFGAQTQAALAKYQAAKNISPAAGYFGPITRAAVAAEGGSTGGDSDDDDDDNGSDGDLSGGEADLSDFELSREESSGAEGAEAVEVFTAEFDVEDGDILIERMEIMASSTSSTDSNNPWDYFDRVSVMVDGDEVAEMDVDSRSDWDEENGQGDDRFSLTLTGLDLKVEEGDRAEITVAFDIAGTIDSADITQDFVFWIEDEGIRGTDAEGIQQYTGDDTETVTFGFDEEENGDLRIGTSSDDPDASILVSDDEDESEEYTVFVFEIENRDDVDSLITEIVVDVNETGSGSTTDEIIDSATLVVDGDEYDGDIASSVDGDITFEDLEIEIGGDEEMTFELVVTLVEDAPTSVTALVFDVSNADDAVEAEGLDSGDDATVEGSATSASHTIAATGIVTEPVSTSQSVTTPGDTASASYGTYTIKFDVTALEEDAYIDDVAASGTVTNGVGFVSFGDSFTGTSSSILTSTADTSGGYFLVEEGETETFTLTVTLNPSAAGTFGVRLDEVNFNDAASAGDTVYTVDASNEDYRTDAVYIAN